MGSRSIEASLLWARQPFVKLRFLAGHLALHKDAWLTSLSCAGSATSRMAASLRAAASQQLTDLLDWCQCPVQAGEQSHELGPLTNPPVWCHAESATGEMAASSEAPAPIPPSSTSAPAFASPPAGTAAATAPAASTEAWTGGEAATDGWNEDDDDIMQVWRPVIHVGEALLQSVSGGTGGCCRLATTDCLASCKDAGLYFA